MKKVIAKIGFLSEEEGGRSQPIPVMNYGCPVFFDSIPKLSEHAYDCRLLIPDYGSPIFPGDTIENLKMVFLSPDEVIPHLRKGCRFSLWERKIIARGEVSFIENNQVI